MPESNVHMCSPVAPSIANVLCVGVYRVDHAVDHDRLRLQTARLAAVVGPGQLELLHVAAVDLVEARVAHLLGPAAVAAQPR